MISATWRRGQQQQQQCNSNDRGKLLLARLPRADTSIPQLLANDLVELFATAAKGQRDKVSVHAEGRLIRGHWRVHIAGARDAHWSMEER
eukprot:15452274-Alexandrium_andersonii.AAC.2